MHASTLLVAALPRRSAQPRWRRPHGVGAAGRRRRLDGRGGLRSAPGSLVALGSRIWRPAVADVDRDGALDAIGAAGSSLLVAAGDSRGRLRTPTAATLGDGWTVIAADLDGDGLVDLAAPGGATDALWLWLAR